MSPSLATCVNDLPCFIAICLFDPYKISNFYSHFICKNVLVTTSNERMALNTNLIV